MTISFKRKTKKQEIAKARRKRMDQDNQGKGPLLAADKLASTLLFTGLTLAIVLICFAGQSPSSPLFLAHKEAKMQVVAAFSYSYTSDLLTEQAKEQISHRIGPTYEVNMEPYEEFRAETETLLATLNDLQTSIADADPEQRSGVIEAKLAEHPVLRRLGNNTLEILLSQTEPDLRKRLFEETLQALQDILREGIPSPTEDDLSGATIVNDGSNRFVRPISLEEAWRLLKANISVLENANLSVKRALFSYFKRGLQPNLRFDVAATQQRIDAARERIEPVVVDVTRGEQIIAAGTKPERLQMEKYRAYREELRERGGNERAWSPELAQRIILSFAIVGAAFLYVYVSLPHLANSRRRITLFSVVLFFNLVLLRLILEMSDAAIFEQSTTIIAILRYALPIAIGPMILAMMLGAAPAVLLSLLLALFNAMMQGNNFDALVISFLGGLVAVYFSIDARTRSKLMRAGTLSGVAVALGLAFVGFFGGVEIAVIAQQMLAALLIGALSAFVVIGLLPLLENSFKYITDITLLELTDYNHPLLRKLQITAPGTYHHSLMVANLSERAAQEIGCNPLVCRAACLFHDIGKMVKPEYFIENQRDSYNPHMEKNPSMSALIIKAHVKEGVEMAKQAKLPLVIIDVIRQHHGTGLISYFYHRALEQTEQANLPLSFGGQQSSTGGKVEDSVDESSFRYAGPRPRFKESGIIFFADAVEAASRSLKKVTPQSVEELIDKIFKDRIEDHQLDDCPLTTQDLKRIRKSFAFTLLNMLHSRIEYPNRPAKTPQAHATRQPFPRDAHKERRQPAG